MRRRHPLPPFGHELDEPLGGVVFVLAGADAWQCRDDVRAGARLLLPPGRDPRRYRWPVAGYFVEVLCCTPPPGREVFALLVELHRAGAAALYLRERIIRAPWGWSTRNKIVLPEADHAAA